MYYPSTQHRSFVDLTFTSAPSPDGTCRYRRLDWTAASEVLRASFHRTGFQWATPVWLARTSADADLETSGDGTDHKCD